MFNEELITKTIKEAIERDMSSDYYNVRVDVNVNEDLYGKKTIQFGVSATRELDEDDAEYVYEDSHHHEERYAGYVPTHIVDRKAEELADLLFEIANDEFENLGECYVPEIIQKSGEDVSDNIGMTVYRGDHWNPDGCEYDGAPEVGLECVLEIKEL